MFNRELTATEKHYYYTVKSTPHFFKENLTDC